MNKRGLVSIVLPVYNTERQLPATLEALAGQTCENFEVIAVDDGSTDSSAAILDTFAAEDSRFTIIHTGNEGVWRARKRGIATAKGEYVGFCDSDDIPLPDMYRAMYERARQTGADITVCPLQRVDADTGKILSADMEQFADMVLSASKNPGFLPVVNTGLWNKLFRCTVLENLIEFDQPPRVLEDMMLMCGLYPFCDTVAFLSQPLYRYMVRSGSAMSAVRPAEVENLKRNMLATRAFVQAHTADERFLDVCDLMAFIHLGLSVSLQLQVEAGSSLGREIAAMLLFLDENFPRYKQSPYATLRYNRENGGQNRKVMLALWCYRLNVLSPIFRVFRFASEKLHLQIKW